MKFIQSYSQKRQVPGFSLLELSKKLVVVFLCLLTVAAHSQDTTDPEKLVEITVSEIIGTINANEELYSVDKSKLRAMVEERVAPRFNFARMTQLTLGQNWSKGSDDEKKTVVKEFRFLLIKTYSNALFDFRTDLSNISITKQSQKETMSVVKVNVNGGGNRSAVLHLRLQLIKEQWQVVDVMVNGVSLIINYRTTFANEIAQGGFPQLIAMLQAENAKE